MWPRFALNTLVVFGHIIPSSIVWGRRSLLLYSLMSVSSKFINSKACVAKAIVSDFHLLFINVTQLTHLRPDRKSTPSESPHLFSSL